MIAIPTTTDEREAHARRTVRCSSCRAPIVWFTTALGKNMPVDAATVSPIDVTLELPRHISHFATCPNRDKHRKPANARMSQMQGREDQRRDGHDEGRHDQEDLFGMFEKTG